MTVNDIKVLKNAGSVLTFNVDDRNTYGAARTIKAGEPVKICGNYVARVGDDTPQISIDQMVGVAAKESTETATVNGTVDVITLQIGQTVLRGAASTAGNVDTASELLAYLNNYILFDASYTVFNSSNEGVITIDENQTSDPNKYGLILIDGSADAAATCDVLVHVNATLMGSLIGQTID